MVTYMNTINDINQVLMCRMKITCNVILSYLFPTGQTLFFSDIIIIIKKAKLKLKHNIYFVENIYKNMSTTDGAPNTNSH